MITQLRTRIHRAYRLALSTIQCSCQLASCPHIFPDDVLSIRVKAGASAEMLYISLTNAAKHPDIGQYRVDTGSQKLGYRMAPVWGPWSDPLAGSIRR